MLTDFVAIHVHEYGTTGYVFTLSGEIPDAFSDEESGKLASVLRLLNPRFTFDDGDCLHLACQDFGQSRHPVVQFESQDKCALVALDGKPISV